MEEAYLLGVSTRRVDDLVRSLGIAGISKSEVSRICAALDAEAEAFRNRPLTDCAYPYVWLDATYLKVREQGRVVSMAALVATGVAMSGERRVLGLELAAGNDEGSAWPAFIRGLCGRGLHGVRLVISDDHAGLVKAIREHLLGSGWQRCRVHLTRNAQDLVPRSARSMIASAVRAVFEQPDERAAHEQLGRVIDTLEPRFPTVARLLADAEPDLLAHFTFPETHRRQIRSTDESVKTQSVELGWTRVTAQAKSGVPGMSALPRSRRLGAREVKSHHVVSQRAILAPCLDQLAISSAGTSSCGTVSINAIDSGLK